MLAADCDSCLQTRPVTAAMTAFSITTGNITASPGRQSAEEWPSSHWHSCSGPPPRSTSLDFYCAIFFYCSRDNSQFLVLVSWIQAEKLHTILHLKPCVFQGEKMTTFCPLFTTSCRIVQFCTLLNPMC